MNDETAEPASLSPALGRGLVQLALGPRATSAATAI